MSNYGHIELEDQIDATDVESLVAGMRSANAQALGYYHAMKSDKSVDRLTYRCSQGCLLLDVTGAPDGYVFYFPPFKRSPAANASTAAKARQKNTRDGDRRWKERAAHVRELEPAVGDEPITLTCDHLRRLALEWRTVSEDWQHRRKEVKI